MSVGARRGVPTPGAAGLVGGAVVAIHERRKGCSLLVV
jgi:hypothetical protein